MIDEKVLLYRCLLQTERIFNNKNSNNQPSRAASFWWCALCYEILACAFCLATSYSVHLAEWLAGWLCTSTKIGFASDDGSGPKERGCMCVVQGLMMMMMMVMNAYSVVASRRQQWLERYRQTARTVPGCPG